jgi:antitoxin component YwqK of YwqJK toxin-antitoxin module
MEGVWRWFFPSGMPFREEIYTNGKPHGLCIQYSDSATIVTKGTYSEGEREGEWIEDIGDAREEGSYSMGLKDGVWQTYYRNGNLAYRGNFVQGVPDGRHLFYYPDGTLREEQNYVMGRRDKNWKKYYDTGALFLTITYKNDNETRINGIRID